MIIVTKKPVVAKNISTTNMEDNRGLANRMWQFAYFLAFAMEHKITLINSSFAEHAEHFEGTRQNLFCSFPQIRIPFAININWLNRIFKISLWFKRISKSLRHRMPILNNIFSFISIKEKFRVNEVLRNVLDISKRNKQNIKTSTLNILLENILKYYDHKTSITSTSKSPQTSRTFLIQLVESYDNYKKEW